MCGVRPRLCPQEPVLPAPPPLPSSLILLSFCLFVCLSSPCPAPSLSSQPTPPMPIPRSQPGLCLLWHGPLSPRRDKADLPPRPSMPVPGRPCHLLPSQYPSLFWTFAPNSALPGPDSLPWALLFSPSLSLRVSPPRGAISAASALAPLYPGQPDDPTVENNSGWLAAR